MTDKSTPLANQIRQMLEAIASEPDPAACPWCASTDDAEVVKFGCSWAIVCDGCGAQGPHADTEAGAIELWNGRPPPAAFAALEAEGAELMDNLASYRKAITEADMSWGYRAVSSA